MQTRINDHPSNIGVTARALSPSCFREQGSIAVCGASDLRAYARIMNQQPMRESSESACNNGGNYKR
jgi:hypothetical protein